MKILRRRSVAALKSTLTYLSRMFNNREIALCLWIVVGGGWLLIQSADIRRSLWIAIRGTFAPATLRIFFVLAVYVGGVVLLLYRLGFWTGALLKSTVLWFLLSGTVLLVRAITERDKPDLLRIVVMDTLKLTILLEFLVGTYTFSLLWEFFVVIPAAFFVGLLHGAAGSRKEYASLLPLTTALVGLVGASLLVNAMVQASGDVAALANLDTTKEILLIPTLTAALIPGLLLFQHYTDIDRLFRNLKIGKQKSPAVVRYARRKLLQHLLFRVGKARSFLRRNGLRLTVVEARADVDALFIQLADEPPD